VGDRTYTGIEARLAQIGDERNRIAARMIEMLDAAAFDNQRIDQGQAAHLEHEAEALIDQASRLAG
jgi:hypothetical protein